MSIAEAFAPLQTRSSVLNDVHSGLNRTQVAEIARPLTVDSARSLVATCARARQPLALMGARHSMGGQQFLGDGMVLDTAALDRIESFDNELGLVVVEAGIRWPALLDWLQRNPSSKAEIGRAHV